MAAGAKQEPNLSMNPRIEQDRALITDAKAKGKMATLGVFARLSGPGWLQSAITLGGGSLASSLYLGVLGGFMFMWLQPVAMLAGIVMLSAIAYITLSTGQRPLQAINQHVSPILGWGWLLASMMANLVWSLPQFALATASFQQNLFPGVFGTDALIPAPWNKVAVGLIILAITLTMGTVYSIGGKGVKVFEIIVKGLVGTTVLCFIGVVVTLTLRDQLAWGAILDGFIPRLSLLSQPVESLRVFIDQVPEQFQGFWTDLIVGQQRDVMISAAATAVGINMTFLFPYSMLRKGWDRDFRELAIFDLSTGLFFPFLIATSCVVIAAASQFNAKPAQGFIPLEGQSVNAEGQIVGDDGELVLPAANLVKGYGKLLTQRLGEEFGGELRAKGYDELLTKRSVKKYRDDVKKWLAAKQTQAKVADLNKKFGQLLTEPLVEQYRKELRAEDGDLSRIEQLVEKYHKDVSGWSAVEWSHHVATLPDSDKYMAAMLVKRDAFNLADTLAPLTGKGMARYVFGLGVLGMAMGAATMLMLINGLCFCELLNRPAKGWTQRIGMAMVSVGILGPFFWGDAKMWLAIPTSVFAMTLLPFAYLSFFLLMNQKKFLGKDMPRGGTRFLWNTLMAISAGLAAFASIWSLWSKLGWWGIGIVVFFFSAVAIDYVRRSRARMASGE